MFARFDVCCAITLPRWRHGDEKESPDQEGARTEILRKDGGTGTKSLREEIVRPYTAPHRGGGGTRREHAAAAA